jgi:hypothetical protein
VAAAGGLADDEGGGVGRRKKVSEEEEKERKKRVVRVGRGPRTDTCLRCLVLTPQRAVSRSPLLHSAC